MEAHSGGNLKKITDNANILRRKALSHIMQSPIGVANEILQIDAGWSRIETVTAVRKVKLA